MPAQTLSARVPQALCEQLDSLAAMTRRNRSWHIEEALRLYLQDQSWQVRAIQEAFDDYRSGNAFLIPHEEVMAEMEQMLESKLGGKFTGSKP